MAAKVSIREKFDAAVKAITTLPPDGPFQPSNDLKLKIYGCYKQATVGPCNIPRPSFWDVVNKAKWDAWAAMGQIGKEEAMKCYVEEIGKFVEMMPQNEAVRDLSEKLNVYEWVESGSTKSYSDSGVECNGIDERLELIRPTLEKMGESEKRSEVSKRKESAGDGAKTVRKASVEDATHPIVVPSSSARSLNGSQDASSASETSSVKENPHFQRIGKASSPENDSDDSLTATTSPLTSKVSVNGEVIGDANLSIDGSSRYVNNLINGSDDGNGPDVITEISEGYSEGVFPRVSSKNSLQNSFNASMLVGSTGLLSNPPNGPTEEETRKVLLSIYGEQPQTSGTDGGDGDPRCPVFNSVHDGLDESLSEDDDDEYCDSEAPLETENASSENATPSPPPPAINAAPSIPAQPLSPSAVSPCNPHLSTASICSTDSELYVTPSMVTPDDGEDIAEVVANATSVLEREVKQLVDASLFKVEELPLQMAEMKKSNSPKSCNKEDLNFPLANEIRARALTPKKVADDVVQIPTSHVIVAQESGKRSSASVDVRPKTTTAKQSNESSSPRYRRVNPDKSPERDEVRVLSDIDDVALRPSRSFINHRSSQASTNSRMNAEEDSSSSDSSHSSAWSPTGGSRRRNFDDWPIRSGDDFKAKKHNGVGKGCGRKHRDSDTTSAGGGGGGGRVGAPASSVNNASRGRGGQASSSRGRSSTYLAPSGGAGGLPPPYHPPAASAMNEQIAVALLRIQQDVSTLNARINTLETLFWTPRHSDGRPYNNGAAGGDSGLTPPSPASAVKPIATTILNWLFPGFSLRSVVFLLLWPILAKGAYLIVKALIGLALMKRRRFIDGHDDLPPL